MITDARIVCKDANIEDYLRESSPRGTPEFVMSSSAMKEFWRCPRRWKDGYKSPSSPALKWGSLLDMRLTQPDTFNATYVVEPETYPAEVKKVWVQKPWTYQADYCKEWRRNSLPMIPISREELEKVERATARIMNDDLLSDFVSSSDRQVWLAAVWNDKATGIKVPIRCLVDFVPRADTPWNQILGDLKTTQNASLRRFSAQVYQLSWHVQSALYLDVYKAASGEDRGGWSFIVQENFEPYQTARRILDPSYIELGKRTYESMLKSYCQCLKTEVWPDYDCNPFSTQGWSVVSPEEWMLSAHDKLSVQEPYESPEDDVVPDEDQEPTDIAH